MHKVVSCCSFHSVCSIVHNYLILPNLILSCLSVGIGAFGTGNGGGSNIARACVTAMEKNVRLFFGNSAMKSTQGAIVTPTIIPSRDFRFLPTIQSIRNRLFYKKNRLESTSKLAPIPDVSPVSLVGCMCHSTENLLNFYETNLARVSDDFYPKDVASQTVHLVSCAYNSVMIGEIAIADYDMFSSNHVAAEMHAAVRAISGGPVYVSDAPGNHNATLLGRLVLPNGRILRTTLPARPTLDCLFKDVMRDGKTALKIWSFNKANAVLGVFNVQGAGWDQATRRYETYNMNPPVVAVESRPRDLPLEFASLDFQSFAYESKNLYESKSSLHYEPKSSTIDPLQSFREKNKKGSAPSNQISTNGGSRDNIFVAWSSAHRKLHFMSTKNDGVKHSLNSRDWDIITFCHLHSVPCNMNMESQHIVSDTASGLLVKDKVAKLFTRPLDKQHTAEEKFLSSIGTRHSVDSQTSHSKSNSGLIYWTPIGLLDMLNGGGAVDDIIPTTTSSTVSSSNGVFSVRGPGRCGIFSSRIPSKILVDNQQITTESIHAEPQSFGGYLLTFELKAQGSNGRLLTGESTISILDSVGTASNLNDEYALGDKLRVVSVHWS